MSLGMAPLSLVLVLLGQTLALEQAPPPALAQSPVKTTVQGDKEFEIPAAFSKKVPETLDDLKAIEKHVQLLTKKVLPATVSVRIGAASGSGVIIDRDGHILTAGHVSGDADRKCDIIMPDGRILKGKTLGANREIDSGMIVITDKAEFPYLEMSKSAPLKRGDWCLAVGHPGGFQKGRSPVVRLGRVLDNQRGYIRTDCTLVGGDSGGPLFDMQGKVIGIHSRIGNDIAANLHVPVDSYRETWDKLAAAEIWGRDLFGASKTKFGPYLGVKPLEEAEIKAFKIREVMPDSPAQKAGLKVDDVIAKLDGKEIGSVPEFRRLMEKKNPDEKVKLEIRRGDETLQMEIKLGKQKL